VVGADGARSKVRELAGIGTTDFDYGQSAVVARVLPKRPHGNTAYERFTDTGPLALVPVDPRTCGAIWAVPRDEALALLALPAAEFAARLAARTGQRLGGIREVGPRRAYPLVFSRAKAIVADRVMLAGNAAHTIHPNAAQGLNLGARDAAWIAEIVAEIVALGGDPGGPAALARYQAARERDHDRVIAFSDGLTRLFYNDFPPAILARDLAMLATDLFPPLKRTLMRRAMGLHGRQPRLVRGIPLSSS
jgi:2-octaprenyl-6-methoxyphenol hydroxylase